MTHALIDLGNPVSDHPLNRGILLWWLGLPNNSCGALRFFDVRNRNNCILTNGCSRWHAAPNGMPSPQIRGTGGSSNGISERFIGKSGAYHRTLSAYLRIDSGTNQNGIIRMGHMASTSDFSLEVRSGTSIGFNGWFADYNFTVPAQGVWFHVAITYNGSLNSAYVNGVLAGSASMTLTTTDVGLQVGVFGLNSDGSQSGSRGAASVSLANCILHDWSMSASQVWQLAEQSRKAFPDMLRRFSRRAYLFGSAVGGGGGGNRRRRILLGAS